MKKFPVILDLETKYTFRDFPETKKLGVSIASIFDYKDEKPYVFLEKELNRLFTILENASYVIGFNIESFDMQVLSAYYPGNVSHFSTFDILRDIREKVGKSMSLNEIVQATLGKKKSGHGLMAIDYYREGKIEELKKYCMDDVALTRELFDYGVKKGEIHYLNEKGKVSLKVEWKKYLEDNGKGSQPLTLPF